MSQLFFAAVCFLVASKGGQCALLNCSAFVPPPPPVRALSSLPRAPLSKADNNGRDGYGEQAARLFYEPLLHSCFEANPYDKSQLPLEVAAPFDAFNVRS